MPPELQDGLTLADLLTISGATIASFIVTSVVSIIKTTFANAPGPLKAISGWDGMFMASVLCALLYVWVYVGVVVDPFTAFIAWIATSLLALGIHKGVVKPVVTAVKGDT